MGVDIRKVKDMNGLITYLAEKLSWRIDLDDFEDIEDIAYDFEAEDIGLKEEAFVKIQSLRQLPPLVDGQKWGIFCVEFDSKRFEVTALRKILSGLIPKRRNSADHAVWDQKDLLFICFWGSNNERTIGLAHFEDVGSGLPQIKMISCCPAVEDFTQIKVFEDRLKNLKWPANYMNHEKWQEDWSNAFTTGYKQTIQDASTLTVQLAIEAQGIKKRILDILEIETSTGYVHLLYEKFKNTLIHDMTETQFADMYAQTVVYGLFSARCMDETQEDFSAAEAVDCIPNTNPFLKSLMKECLGSQNNSKLSFDELEIGNVVDLLLHTKTEAIIQDFNRQTGGGREDPVIHFYEEFLMAYDKDQKVQRGVYYTPQPVVNFIIRAVDSIIKNEFGLEDGLSSIETKKMKFIRESKRRVDGFYRTQVEDVKEVPAIQILDPATGTGTFLRQTILQIYENFKEKNRSLDAESLRTAWNEYVPQHLLPRLNGFELMMAPYAVAHMKLAMVLKDTGYDFNSDERLNVFLTNTLEEPGTADRQMTIFDDPLASEAISANAIKKNTGINIIIGNPPYSTESSNKGEWINSLMESFKTEFDGVTRLQERNSKPLNDDYVKFIRYAKEILDHSSEGVMAFINPHGFIDGPIFRGMRASLMRAFDSIYIFDLHGNANRQETTPDGGKDENVFDIKQGVCICVLVKRGNTREKRGIVYHADIYGLRDDKYKYLLRTQWKDVPFEEIKPTAPDCLFKKVDKSLRNEYEKGFSINDLFCTGMNGIKTARDKFTLGFSIEEISERMETFRKMDPEEARDKYALGKDVQEWQVSWAQRDLNTNAVKNGALDANCIIPVNYRVFDTRYMVFTGTSCGIIGRPRTEMTNQFVLGYNIGLATGRTNKTSSCNHFLAVDHMIEMKCAERSTCAAVFPLYTYYPFGGGYDKQINFKKDIIKVFSNRLGLEFITGHEQRAQDSSFNEKDLFCYVYAILYNNSYRDKYSEFIKADFPRIPYIQDKEIFWKLVRSGRKLINLHLMREDENYAQNSCFIDNGRDVERVKYKDGRIYINKKSYFDDISDKDWTFLIGGYPPLQYWFKERKGKTLSSQEIQHYKAMVVTVKETQSIMDEIVGILDFS